MYTTYSNYRSNPTAYSHPYGGSTLTYPPNLESDTDDDRIIGTGLLAPFLLGGVTGLAVAPYFYPRPYYPRPFYPYPPYRRRIW